MSAEVQAQVQEFSIIEEFPIKEAYTSDELNQFAEVLGYSSIGVMTNTFIKNATDDEPFSFASIAKAANQKKVELHQEAVREAVVSKQLEAFRHLTYTQIAHEADQLVESVIEDVEELGNFNVEGVYPFEDAVINSDVHGVVKKVSEKFRNDVRKSAERLADTITKAIDSFLNGKKVTGTRSSPSSRTPPPTRVEVGNYVLEDSEITSWSKAYKTVVEILWTDEELHDDLHTAHSKLMAVANTRGRHFIIPTNDVPENMTKFYTEFGMTIDPVPVSVSLYTNINVNAIKRAMNMLCDAVEVELSIHE